MFLVFFMLHKDTKKSDELNNLSGLGCSCLDQLVCRSQLANLQDKMNAKGNFVKAPLTFGAYNNPNLQQSNISSKLYSFPVNRLELL